MLAFIYVHASLARSNKNFSGRRRFDCCEQGTTFRQIGQLLDVHPDTVGRWYKRYQVGAAEAIAV